MAYKNRPCSFSFAVWFLFSTIIYILDVLCVTSMLPPHSVAFVFGRNMPASHSYWICLHENQTRVMLCCWVFLHFLCYPYMATLFFHPAAPFLLTLAVLLHFVNLPGLMTSWCSHIRVFMATEERPVQNKRRSL